MRYLAPIVAIFVLSNTAFSQDLVTQLPEEPSVIILRGEIDTQVANLIGTGEARKKHAEAERLEIENHLKRIDAYFEGRRKNREYRREENPPLIVRRQKQDNIRRNLIINQPQRQKESGLILNLNWMLNELIAMSPAWGPDATPFQSNYQMQPIDRRNLIVRESTTSDGNKLSFSLDDGDLFKVKWPMALRRKELREELAAFDRAKNRAMQAARTPGGISWEAYQHLASSFRDLSDNFYRVYDLQKAKRVGDVRTREYLQGVRCLKTLVTTIERLGAVGEIAEFENQNFFNGQTLSDLILFMGRRGLQFSAPRPNGRAAYFRLFDEMRHAYLQIEPAPEAAFFGDDDDGFDGL